MAEQQANPDVRIPALHETLEDVRRWLGQWTVIVRRRGGRLVAAARGRVETHGNHAGAWDVGRLMVAPDLQGQGLGRDMLERIEAAAPAGVSTYVLFTGAGSLDNIRMYKKAGYRLRGPLAGEPGAVVLTRRR
ncbi:GNAT family N-acetyltransferase [Nocardioides sp. CF8]|uniref:GNAT family N-acetyltransferase n=1 Tax=Nocardioides sp. CF8 TaxID=110319 RepID=UPI001E444512|nr:GNAT family N-acetyltransferase [Nocardioides sp. CF8]